MNNVETVQAMYAAFGRGDVPGILAHLAEDVDWEYGGGSSDEPLLQPRKGREAVPGFFATLVATIDLTRFEPKAFLAGQDVVVVLIDVEATFKANGRQVIEEDEVHIWRFGPDGRVTRFRHRADTYQWWAAFHDR
ncbi:MAG TPA: nuclear transport factor 2 family protein [Thermoanaerobaculia bacterium]|nr:nuclear transport factor 2 family protein [Thermoanaerobaculia bacterium]